MGPTRIPAESTELLAFDGVSFAVDADREILHEVSLSVAPAAVTVLAGPSGAGKSTLLRLGNRLDIPSAGSVRFRGQDSAAIDPRELRRRVGMVFQKPVPFAGSVRMNLKVGAPLAGDEELARTLERVGLEASVLDRVADDLSGGEAQRMCIARTLLTQPEVILMDEPTSALDHENRLGIEHLAKELAQEGIGILWVSHDLSQVRRIADHAVVLIDGRNASAAETAAFLDQGMSEDKS
ncbi:MAG: phosphate ABC transporter ATP-binding protein [Actinomycetia bacterium]|nr:phosphate ABC transporter ATP-binding protein [Actinomycetes bacterium]